MPDLILDDRSLRCTALRRAGPAAFAAIVMAGSPAFAVTPALSEGQAREKAIDVLLGEPYGATREDVRRAIVRGHLVKRGDRTICGSSPGAAWLFDVSAFHEGKPINGSIQISASGGAMMCANLPFLD